MFKKFCLAGISLGALGIISATAAHAQMPSREEMWRVIQQQQQQIEALQQQVQQTDAKTERVADAVETQSASAVGTAPSAAGAWWDRTSIGGYGELHYNNYLDSADGTDEVDFHRFVLFFGHEFNERIRFFSELELEHALAGEGKPGEIELEQAFVEFDLNDRHRLQAGLFLLPVGILNETHEPDTFFGVERNPIEANIIPTTWWEAGVGARGELGNGFSYATAVHSGLNSPTSGSNAFKIRNGRQKVADAVAENGAVTGALSYTGVPGLTLGISGQYQSDMTQDSFAESISATLFEAHADVRRGPWGLRTLYARWDLSGDAPEQLGRDVQEGFYIEPSYRFATTMGDMGVFTRYNYWDNEAGLSSSNGNEQWDVGLNYWPHANVVLKADMAFLEESGGNHSEILNLGVGYQF